MFFTEIPKYIDLGTCVDESRLILNNNFNLLQQNAINLQLKSLEYQNAFNVTSSNVIDKLKIINAHLTHTVCGIKMHLLNNTTIEIIHHNGDGLYLFDTVLNKWLYKVIPGNTTFSLENLKPDTSYDIFLGFIDNTLKIKFEEWSNTDQGYTRRSNTSNIIIVDNIKVHRDIKAFRYLGCLRTTFANTSEASDGGSSAAGVHPKQLLWNYYNRSVKNICNKVTGQYYNLYNYTDSNTIKDVLINTSYSNEKDSNSSGSCFTFIVGDYTEVDMIYTNYFTLLDNNATVYSAISINNTIDFNNELGSMVMGIKTVQGKGNFSNTISTFKSVLPAGLYKIQTLDASTNNVKFNDNYDTTLKTGFLCSLSN